MARTIIHMETLIIIQIKSVFSTHILLMLWGMSTLGCLNAELVNSHECITFSIALDNIESTGYSLTVERIL